MLVKGTPESSEMSRFDRYIRRLLIQLCTILPISYANTLANVIKVIPRKKLQNNLESRPHGDQIYGEIIAKFRVWASFHLAVLNVIRLESWPVFKKLPAALLIRSTHVAVKQYGESQQITHALLHTVDARTYLIGDSRQLGLCEW